VLSQGHQWFQADNGAANERCLSGMEVVTAYHKKFNGLVEE
jgi:hypothetical protein